MDILDRIIYLMRGREQRELTRYLGLNDVTFSEWKSGKSKSYRKYLIEIANFFEVSLDFLVYGQTSNEQLSEEQSHMITVFNQLTEIDRARVMERAETLAQLAAEKSALKAYDKKEPDSRPGSDEGGILIPFFDMTVSAGTGIDIDYTTSENIRVGNAYDEADFAVRVSGDSMKPQYQNGDIILVKSTPVVEIDEIGIFILNGQSYIKKRGESELISLNEDYRNIPIGEDDSLYCQGKVVGVLSPDDRRTL